MERSLSETAMCRGLPGRSDLMPGESSATPSSTRASTCAADSASSTRGEPAPIASRASSTTDTSLGRPAGSPRAARKAGSIAYEIVSAPVTSRTRLVGTAEARRTSIAPLKSPGSRDEGVSWIVSKSPPGTAFMTTGIVLPPPATERLRSWTVIESCWPGRTAVRSATLPTMTSVSSTSLFVASFHWPWRNRASVCVKSIANTSLRRLAHSS